MNKHTRYGLVLATGLALGAARPAAAQDDKKVYTYVEQMPQLPGGGGLGAVQAAILKNYRYPADAQSSGLPGSIYVRFNVTETGEVADVQVIRGVGASANAAAIDAVKRLPRFIPGKQNGKAVTVAYTVPLKLTANDSGVSYQGASPAPDLSNLSGEGNRPSEEIVEDKVYTYVEQMPQLPGGGGSAAIVAAIQKALVLPPDAQEGRVFIKFTVRPTGKVDNLETVKGLSLSTDGAVLAATRQLPTFEPGKQNGRPVAVSFTVPVTVRLANHVYEAREVTKRARFAQPGLYPYLQHHLHVPAVVASEKLHGLVGVDFVVQASGKIENPTLTSHLCASCDEEVLRLVKGFPAWVPARADGDKEVAVRQHLDVPLPLPSPDAPYTKPEKLYTYVSQPPTLLDGTPTQELGALLTQTIQYPETARREKIIGTAQLEFQLAADGTVHNARLTQSVCTSCDQAILAALAAVGPLVPGRQADQAVPMQLQVSVPFNPTLAAASAPVVKKATQAGK